MLSVENSIQQTNLFGHNWPNMSVTLFYHGIDVAKNKTITVIIFICKIDCYFWRSKKQYNFQYQYKFKDLFNFTYELKRFVFENVPSNWSFYFS